MARTSGAELRKKILEEAIGIVYREGPGRVTMRTLAEKLGYSVATIYIYFRNKDELLKEIALHGFDALAEAVEPAGQVEDPFEAVADMARRYIQFGLEQPELYRLMFQDISISSLLTADEVHRALRGWQASKRVYARGIESGVFRKSDPVVEANVGWAWVHGFVQLARAGRLPLKGMESGSLTEAREAMIAGRLRALRP